MRDVRLLLLSGLGVATALAAGACATEAQEPGVTGMGPTSGLTSDSGSETSTETATSTSATTSPTMVSSGPATTATSTTGDADATSTETVTTGPSPLGGTVTSATVSSTTSNSATTGTTGSATATSAATATSTTSSTESSTGNGGMGGMGGTGMTSMGGLTATTGGGSCTATPATAPVPLVPDDGWLDCSDNSIGIQGGFFTYSDGNGSTITSAFTGDDICVSGTVGQAVSNNSVWGAGFGFNVNQDEPEGDVETWNANAMGISGFRFNLSAMPSGTGLRLVYQSGGTDYCVAITSSGTKTVRFADTAEACWGSGGGAPNPATLEQVKWQVTTNSSEHDFDFCITQLAAIP